MSTTDVSDGEAAKNRYEIVQIQISISNLTMVQTVLDSMQIHLLFLSQMYVNLYTSCCATRVSKCSNAVVPYYSIVCNWPSDVHDMCAGKDRENVKPVLKPFQQQIKQSSGAIERCIKRTFTGAIVTSFIAQGRLIIRAIIRLYFFKVCTNNHILKFTLCFTLMQDGSKGGGSSRRKPKVTHKVVDTDDDGGPSGDEGSSRRKPKVTHKVVDTDDDAGSNADEKDGRETPFETYKDTNGVNDPNNESKGKEEAEKKDDDIIDVDEDGNPILPEGITIIHPKCRVYVLCWKKS